MRIRVLGAVLLLSACGGKTMVTPRPTPTPTPTPTRTAGGTVQGDYVLRIEPALSCGAPAASLSFLVTAYAADTTRSPGIQILPRDQPSLLPPDTRVSDDAPVIEGELQYTTPDVRGGIGSPTYGVPAQEGFQLFIHAMASGSVSHLGDGAGEILDGTLAGTLQFGRTPNDPGSLGSCASEAHHWSLKLT